MKVSVAVLCDSAVTYGDRLCVMGTFDELHAQTLPLVKSHCSIALQIQWEKPDEGAHAIRAHFMNDDGKRTLDDMESQIYVTVPDNKLFATTTHIINLQQLRFTKAGIYHIAYFVDSKHIAENYLHVSVG